MKKIIALIVMFVIAFSLIGCFPQTTVKFNIDFIVDGEVYDTVKTDKSSIEMPTDPTKEDYEFKGWFWDKDVWEKPLTLNSLMDVPLSQTWRVYAKFIKNEEPTVKLGKYITDDGMSWLVLEENFQYGFNRHIATSWDPTGKYSVQDNILILYLEDEEFAFFNASGDCLIFQSDTPNWLVVSVYFFVYFFCF